jgi:hypothetical protein
MLVYDSIKHKCGQKLIGVFAKELSRILQFFQIEAFLLQPSTNGLAVARSHYQNRGLSPPKAGAGEEADGLSNVVFVGIRIAAALEFMVFGPVR